MKLILILLHYEYVDKHTSNASLDDKEQSLEKEQKFQHMNVIGRQVELNSF